MRGGNGTAVSDCFTLSKPKGSSGDLMGNYRQGFLASHTVVTLNEMKGIRVVGRYNFTRDYATLP
jgi:hypothetical protein